MDDHTTVLMSTDALGVRSLLDSQRLDARAFANFRKEQVQCFSEDVAAVLAGKEQEPRTHRTR